MKMAVDMSHDIQEQSQQLFGHSLSRPTGFDDCKGASQKMISCPHPVDKPENASAYSYP